MGKVDIEKELDDPALVEELRVEPWQGNNFYGIGRILKRYASLPEWFPIPFHYQHGIKFFDKTTDENVEEQMSFYQPSREIPFMVYSSIQEKYLRAEGHDNLKTIGAPLVYMGDEIERIRSTLGEAEGTIAFPSKGTHFSSVSEGFEEFAKRLSELPERFHPVTVSLYYLDIERGNDAPFLERGFKVVSNGKLLSQDFLHNFISNVMPHRYSCSNDLLSSPVYYSIYLGLKFFHLESGVSYSTSEETHGAYARERERSSEICDYEFPIDQIEDEARQKAIADEVLGVPFRMEPKEMRSLIMGSLSLSRAREVFGTARRFKRARASRAQ